MRRLGMPMSSVMSTSGLVAITQPSSVQGGVFCLAGAISLALVWFLHNLTVIVAIDDRRVVF